MRQNHGNLRILSGQSAVTYVFNDFQGKHMRKIAGAGSASVAFLTRGLAIHPQGNAR
jgi:hypothetical protein